MSQGLDVEMIRETYEKMSDAELVRIVSQDAAGLTPEAEEIVRAEIKKRNLNSGLVEAVRAQNKEYTVSEIDRYCELVRNLDCPVCGSSDAPLNATLISEVVSFIIVTQSSKKLKVACPACLDKANSNAIAKSLGLGIWGIPWGIIRTIGAVRRNIISKKTNHEDGPNDFLRHFVLAKVGQFELHKNNKEKLSELIA